MKPVLGGLQGGAPFERGTAEDEEYGLGNIKPNRGSLWILWT